MRLAGEIDNAFFMNRLEDEKELLVSELHTIAIVNKMLPMLPYRLLRKL